MCVSDYLFDISFKARNGQNLSNRKYRNRADKDDKYLVQCEYRIHKYHSVTNTLQ